MENSQRAGHRTGDLGMSYKFQRLRERIRQAVASGELAGKLPGERELARRFHVNAKTLSKALTDLAAEGLLQRSIGRGTFVRGSRTESQAALEPWLLLVDSTSDQPLAEQLKSINPAAEIRTDVSAIRPSYLTQFGAVIDLASATPEKFVRDLLVRGIAMVAVGHEPRTYSVNAVMLDTMLGASQLTRQLVLAGHRHFLAVEERTRITVAETIRKTAARYCQDFCVDACAASDVAQAADYGATACICDSVRGAMRALETLERAHVEVPQRMSVAAIGIAQPEFPCTGYFLEPRQHAAAIAELLRNGQSSRPIVMWLTGTLVDRGTTASQTAETRVIPREILQQTAILVP